jgi:hypothetical protein
MTGQKPSVQLKNAMLHFHAGDYFGRAPVAAWHGMAFKDLESIEDSILSSS